MAWLAALSTAINVVLYAALRLGDWHEDPTTYATGATTQESKAWSWLALRSWLSPPLRTTEHPLQHPKGNKEWYVAHPTTFALFVGTHALLPYFMWPLGISYQWGPFIMLRCLGGMLCLLLLLKNYWPSAMLGYASIYWHITVMYVLPFTTTLTWLILGRPSTWIINIVFAAIILGAVVDRRRFFILGTLGGGLGTATHRLLPMLFGDITVSPSLEITLTQHSIYACIFSIAVSIFFVRQPTKEGDKRVDVLSRLGKVLGREVHDLLTLRKAYGSSIQSLAAQMRIDKVLSKEDNRELLLINVDKQSYGAFKESIHGLMEDSKRGIRTVNRMLATLQHTIDTKDFTKLSMRACVYDALKNYHLTPSQEKSLHVDVEEDFEYYGSAYHMRHVLFNLLGNSHKHSRRDCTVNLRLSHRKLHVKDSGVGIPKRFLPCIFDPFFTTDTEAMGLGLTFCKLVMKSCKGVIICKSKRGERSFTEFILTFPKLEELHNTFRGAK